MNKFPAPPRCFDLNDVAYESMLEGIHEQDQPRQLAARIMSTVCAFFHVRQVNRRNENAEEWIEYSQFARDLTNRILAQGKAERADQADQADPRLTPEQFKEKVIVLLDDDNYCPEVLHRGVDGLMTDLLKQMGYEEGVQLFLDADIWYS